MARHRRLPPEPMAWGDYDYPDRRVTKMTSRSLFLDAIATHRPRVLEDLSREPLQAYAASPLPSDADARFDLRDYLAGHPTRGEFYRHHPSHDATIAALRNWGERWNLSARWCLAHALETLHDWARNPDFPRDWWGFGSFTGSGLRPDEVGFDLRVSHTGWDPAFLTWPEFLQGITPTIEAYLAEYRARVESAAEAMGMTRVEQKAKAHFRWFAIYQTSDLGYATMLEIAREDQPLLSRSGLYQALTNAAEVIELPLRPSTIKGRKRGSRDRGPWRTIVRRSKNTLS